MYMGMIGDLIFYKNIKCLIIFYLIPIVLFLVWMVFVCLLVFFSPIRTALWQ